MAQTQTEIDLRRVINRLAGQLGQTLADLAAAHEMVETQEARIAELTAGNDTASDAAPTT